jgi:hypothetical protein
MAAPRRHVLMASKAYVHLVRRRKRDRISRLHADTKVLRGGAADEPTRSSYRAPCRASWLLLKSIPQDPCLVGVHSLLVAVARQMTHQPVGPGLLPRREDSRSNMRSERLRPSYRHRRIGAFPIQFLTSLLSTDRGAVDAKLPREIIDDFVDCEIGIRLHLCQKNFSRNKPRLGNETLIL